MKFRIRINGENFWLNMENEIKRMGFYKTYFLEKDSAEEAETFVINQIKEHPDLKYKTLNDKSDPPMMYLDEIVEVKNFEGLETLEQGFVFYPEDNAGH